MITGPDGHRYGTAQQIAAALGPDVRPDRVRDWARRSRRPSDSLHGMLPGIRIDGETYHALADGAACERVTRTSTRGRRRTLDVTAPAA